MKEMIASTVYGGVAVSIIQGFLGGPRLCYRYRSACSMGIAMSVMSFVPLVGTLSIWGPPPYI